MLVELKDSDLLSRLHNFEDAFTERKTSSDKKDWLPTVVAFANSVPIDYPAVLFIGAKNDGTVEDVLNLDSLQKSLATQLAKAYPPVFYVSKILSESGRQFLAIVVPGSVKRPHFAGPSYVRNGSVTQVASEKQFNELIAQRSSKAYEISKWIGKSVKIEKRYEGHALKRPGYDATVVECNQFYVTLDRPSNRHSIPLESVVISFDQPAACLKLVVLGLV